MQLSAVQFDDMHRAGKLNLTLVGMSNVGKSYWARELEKIGWQRIWSDGLLQKKMQDAGVLQDASDEGLARWLGMPYEPGFDKRQAEIMKLEAELFWKITRELSANQGEGNIVTDPAGSLSHAGEEVCSAFQKNSFMVYLEATQQMRAEMFERFMKFPKALIWQNWFDQKEGESAQDALARCYPKLLENRARVYAQYADVTIPYEKLTKDGNGQQLIKLIKNALV